jgi:SAM-dependent methyltransferase
MKLEERSMQPKPAHLGPEYGAQFKDRSVAEAYRHRPPYPEETFAILAGLIADEPRAVLDVGCGTGFVARPLAALVERVDAVDFSAAMIARGKGLPGGDRANLTWIEGPVEEVTTRPPYALITAGASLHWLAWDVVLPRFAALLTPRGFLAIVGDGQRPVPWAADLQPIIDRYSTNRDYQPYDLVEELERRGLFRKVGERRTAPVSFRQAIGDYVESFHARNGFSRERMPAEAAAAFDREARAVIARHAGGDSVELHSYGQVVWGKPA